MAVKVDKVLTILVDDDVLKRLWGEENTGDYWADLDTLEFMGCLDLLSPEEHIALSDGTADYIAFRYKY